MPATSVKSFVFIQNYDIAALSSGKIDLSIWNFIVYTAANPTSATNPALIGGYAANLATCVSLGHARGKKVLLSVYFDAPVLISLVNDAVNFPKLVTNIVNAVAAADGVHLDIEGYTQATGAQQIAATDALINALYAALPAGKIIVMGGYAAMPQSGQNYAVINVSLATLPKIAFILLMTYDLAHPRHSTLEDMKVSLESWVTAGFPPAKLGPGIPFYAWDASKPVCSWGDLVAALHPGPDQNQWNISSIISSFTNPQGQSMAVDGGVLWCNGLDMVRQKLDYIYFNGFGAWFGFSGGEDSFEAGYNEARAMYDEEVRLMGAFVFPPGIAKHPKVSFPTDPLGGLAGTIDFFLSADGGVTRVSGPGPKPFVFGGTTIDITLPAVPGDYKAYWDLYVGAFKVFSYYDLNDVIIVPGGTPNPVVW